VVASVYVRLATGFTTASIAAVIGSAGCVDGFRGANVQIDLSPGTPVQAHVIGAQATDEIPANAHYTIFAIQEDATQSRLFELARFELHRIVDTTSPCFIDVGEHVPHQGLHVSQYAAKISEDTGIADYRNPPATATEEQKLLMGTAVQRMANVAALGGSAGIKVVTSASTSVYPAVASSCTGSQDQIPPPNCTDEASNQLRLKLCQAAWKADPNQFEGTDRVLTAPLNGVTRGTALGLNPINMAPVGGAQFFVENALIDIDAYAIYVQADGVEQLGTPLYFGRPTMVTRGVSHVHLASPMFPQLSSEMAVFADLGEDDVHF
jgi:hypothetical protein